MKCDACCVELKEVTLPEALKASNIKLLKKNIKGDNLSDDYIQYHIRSYIGNRSLFLDYDIQKNRMKHGPRIKRFLICSINIAAVFNIPWFFFNIIASNIFHAKYTKYCARCNAKYAPGRHDQEDCDYNIEYFNILEDILSGNILVNKPIYKQYAQEKDRKGWRSAYRSLFCRDAKVETFFDMVSITLSVLFWLFIAIYISWPFAKVTADKLKHIDQYEFALPTSTSH